MDHIKCTQIMCLTAFGPFQRDHQFNSSGGSDCCCNNSSKLPGIKCLRSLIETESSKMVFASAVYPRVISHLGEFGIHLNKMICEKHILCC